MKSLVTAFALALVGTVASAQVVVITNPSAATPSKEAISEVYLGKSQDFAPLDQPESAPIRADFYKKATGRDSAQVKATWSRLLFTGKGQPPKELPDSVAVRKAVASDPKAIGYVEKRAVDGSVKVVLTLE